MKKTYEKNLKLKKTLKNILTGINKEGALNTDRPPKLPYFNQNLIIYHDHQNCNWEVNNQGGTSFDDVSKVKYRSGQIS